MLTDTPVSGIPEPNSADKAGNLWRTFPDESI